jgi:GAF domain-containing protein
MSPTPDSTLADPQHIIAELRRKLAIRTAERDEALARETATAEVLGVINRSPGDLTPVFDAMLEKATRLCDAPSGIFWTFDGEFSRVAALHGIPEPLAEFLRQPIRWDSETGLGRVLRGAGLVVNLDAATGESYRAGKPQARAFVDLGRARSTVRVPLLKDGKLLGIFTVYRQDVRPFSDKQIALLQNFAAQAVIAMENARLLAETREALEQQTATAEVLQVINSSPGDLASVFDAILEKALHLCDAVHGHVWSYDGKHIISVAVCGEPRFVGFMQQLGPIPIRRENPSTTPVSRLLQGERIMHIPDAKELQSYHDVPLYRQIVDISGARTVLSVALRQDNETLGAITLYRQELRPFADKQISLLQDFAAQAVIAMENVRLLGELRQRSEEVAELNRGLEARVAEQVEELGRVGRLKRFLAPQLAELIVSQGDEKILESHRREIVVVFCDLRGYTAFTETAEPEEVRLPARIPWRFGATGQSI